MDANKNNLSREELIEKEKAVVDRICHDDKYAYYFFHEKCRPLFSKILWKIFGNNSDYDELVNELFLLLKKPNKDGEVWHALKTYDYRTTLFDWIKTVAVRHFYDSSKQTFDIPIHIVDTAIIEKIIGEMGKADYRKYMWFKYVERLEDKQVAVKLEIDGRQLKSLSKKAAKHFKIIAEHKFPEYYDCLFAKADKSDVDIEAISNKLTDNTNNANDRAKIDISLYLEAMPNERYRHVIHSLFIKDMEPEELAVEMNIRVTNIYNIKKRALDQLRDLAIYYNEIKSLEKHINLISDDIKREVLTSLFLERASYEVVCSKMNISETELKKLKKDAMKELRNIIFKTK